MSSLTPTAVLHGTIAIGGGSEPVLQEKTVTPRRSEQVVTPDTGYDALSQVTVNATPLQLGVVAYPDGEGFTVEPEQGYVGLRRVSVAPVPLQSKTVTPDNTTQHILPDSGYYGLESVDVGAVNLQSKSVTPSSVQQTVTPDSGYMGLSQVTVGAAGEDSLAKIFSHSASYGQPINISVSQTESQCSGFAGKYNLTITGGNSIGQNAFTYQKYLKNIVADDIKYMSSGDELSYSGLTTGHFANLMELHNNTFRGCESITNLYFGYDGVIGGMLRSGRIFDGKSSGTVNIHVKSSQLSAYQADSTWQGIVSAEAAAGVTVNIVGDYA